jgi:hypothetical protein
MVSRSLGAIDDDVLGSLKQVKRLIEKLRAAVSECKSIESS